MRYARSLSEAFSDERSYCIEGNGFKSGFYLRRRSWWERLMSWFK